MIYHPKFTGLPGLLLLTICLQLTFGSLLTAQPIGKPYLRNYTVNDYGSDDYGVSPQSFDMEQDDRGVIYIANISGVMEYDGHYWRMVDGTTVIKPSSLTRSSKGLIYVGGNNEIGYLSADETGKLAYQSIVDHIPEDYRQFGRIWRAFSTEDAIFFMAVKHLFRWQAQAITVWEPVDNIFYPAKAVDKDILVYNRTVGLLKINQDTLQSLFHADMINNDVPYTFMPLKEQLEQGLILGTYNNGLYLFDGKDQVNPYETAVDPYLKENKIRAGIKYNDRKLVLGTYNGGLVYTGVDGRHAYIVNKESGLYDNSVLSVYKDQQGGVWCTSNRGVSRVEYPAPLTYFDDKKGITGLVIYIRKYKGLIYAATTDGVFTIDPYGQNGGSASFEKVKGIDGQSYALVELRGTLYALTNQGIFRVDHKSARFLTDRIVRWLYPKKGDSTIALGSTNDGIERFTIEKNRIVQKDTVLYLANLVINKFEETDDNELWVWTYGKGILYLDMNKEVEDSVPYKLYYTDHGLPEGEVTPMYLRGKLRFSTSKGYFTFDKEDDYFYPDEMHGIEFTDGDEEAIHATEDHHNNLWASSKNRAGIIKADENGKYYWDPTISMRIPKTDIFYIFPDTNDIYWFGTTDGVIQYNSNIDKDYDQPFASLVRKVRVGEDSVIYWGTKYFVDEWELPVYNADSGAGNIRVGNPSKEAEQYHKPQLPYELNSIWFEYAAPYFEDEKSLAYSFFLEGYDKGWSQWTTEAKNNYTNLPEGQYTFKVRAKNIYNRISREGTFKFVIQPPWYRTIWAFISYTVAFIIFVYVAIQVSIMRLKAAKVRLEKIVQERTKEIAQKNEKLEVANIEITQQKEEIEKKNQNITDSIQYAKKIQEAILPLPEKVKEELPDAFILFKPRDIVSGDFYWFGQNGKKLIIAAADCTGHGVPGAFVSMIGNTMLNKVINEKGIIKPENILTNLHNEIKTALKQDDEGKGSKDGMDIAIGVLDPETNILQFSGAYNPLYILRKDGEEMEEIKANKFPVAGFHFKKERIFVGHTIQLHPGDTFYIFSDGYVDQFGGDDNKRFNYKRFRSLLIEHRQKTMEQQQIALDETIEAWKGERDQIDDILVIGVRV